MAIVIDDLGTDLAAMRQAMFLPPAITSPFFLTTGDVAALARTAEGRGYQVIVHVPMQPLGPKNPGPRALRVALSATENQ